MAKELGPFMPLFIDDFIGGTMYFGAEEVGAYLLLLSCQWQEGEVENQPKVIERISRCEYGKLHRVLRKFDVLPNGNLQNSKCEVIRKERAAFIQKQRENSQKGGEATRNKYSPPAPPKDSPPASQSASPTATPPASPNDGPNNGPKQALPSPSPLLSPEPIPKPKEEPPPGVQGAKPGAQRTAKAGGASSGDDGFEGWWIHYPRKIGKAKARKAWKAVKPKPKVAEVIAALDRLKKSDQWTKDGGQFIPHPTTWINRGGWEDQPDVDIRGGRKPGSFDEEG